MKLSTFVFALLFLAGAAAATQDTASSPEQLQVQYHLTKLTADHTTVVTAGDVLVLKKDPLVMTAAGSADVSGNSYKKGKITQGAGGKANGVAGAIGRIGGILPGALSDAAGKVPTIATRTFVAGEKLYVTRIDAKDKNTVAFELWSVKAYSDAYYHTTLTFPFRKKTPANDQVRDLVGEVFAVTPAQPVATQQPVAAQPVEFKPIDPPHPPPAEPVTIIKGDTVDHVLAAFGQPERIAKTEAKEIYYYKDMKVTFVDGKVAAIQ